MSIEKIEKIINFDFTLNTTYGLGGCAKIAYFPKSREQCITIFDYLKRQKNNFMILGSGSDVLVSDKGFDGSVISTKKFKGVYTQNNLIYVNAGVKVSELLTYCIQQGLSGLEFLAGIPATVGGLLYMNGGADGIYLGEKVNEVRIYNGKERKLTSNDCKFKYKYSVMQDMQCLILSGEFNVTKKSQEKVREKVLYYIQKRKNLPKGKSCGCVFKNPNGLSAGKLIDNANLKGLRIGGAEVSLEHANFILNKGASSDDVYKLINIVKSAVREKYGITLEEEVIYIGEF